MKITMMGLLFENANLGCQALAYSFVNFMEEIGNELGIEMEYTALVYSDKPYVTIPGINKNVRNFTIKYKSLKFWKELRRVYAESDFIFDFTGGDSFSDIYGKKRFYLGSALKKMAIKSKTPFILGPQTYGPYLSKISRNIAKSIIRESSYVFARDIKSKAYIESLVNKEVHLTTDIAFSLPYNKKIEKNDDVKIKIGINPSGLLWNGGYTRDNQFNLSTDYRNYLEELLNYITSNIDMYEIYLIPHVETIAAIGIESDLYVCNELHKKYPKTIVVDDIKNAIDAKSIIAQMDIFIGARMHATIAAFSTGVATIPFSYSMKFEGLYNSLGYEYIIHAREYSLEESINKSIEYIQDYGLLAASVEKCFDSIKMNQEKFFMDIVSIIRNK